MLRTAGVFLIYLFVAAHLARAETLEEHYRKIINDDAAREAIRLALTKINTVTCEPQKPCAPATSEELAQPPITVLDARTAMAFGIKSALMQWCAPEHVLSGPKTAGFELFDWAHRRKKMNRRQILLVTLIHHDFQERQSASLAKLGRCPERQKKELEAELPEIRFGPSIKF